MDPVSRRFFLATASLAAAGHRFASAVPANAAAGDEPLVKYVRPITFRATHTATVTRDDTVFESLEIWVPVPLAWNEQKILDLTITPSLKPTPAKNGPTQVARLLLRKAKAPKTKTTSLVVETKWQRFEIETDIARLDEQKFHPYNEDSDDYKTFTRPEDKVQSDDPEIREAAEKLKGTGRPWAHVARDIYDWLLDRTNLHAVDWKGAKWCHENRAGSSGDYSALFVALCRAAGIPARVNTGYWAAEKNGVHVWAEFLLPTGEWVPVDPSKGDQLPALRKTFFGRIDNNRLTLAKTADVKLPPVEGGAKSVDLLQTGSWWWHGRGGPPQVKYEFEPIRQAN